MQRVLIFSIQSITNPAELAFKLGRYRGTYIPFVILFSVQAMTFKLIICRLDITRFEFHDEINCGQLGAA